MNAAPHVQELIQLLGPGTLLLSWPLGKKGEKRRWKHLTAETMKDPTYLRQLEHGNIGVAQGAVSGGLCSVDVDSDEEAEEFMKLNGPISETLCSRGSRGYNWWWRFTGSYPALTPLKRHGKPWGEFRSTGGQTIIHGQHPDGHAYQIVNRIEPLKIEMIQIKWPEGIYPLLQRGNTVADSVNRKSTTTGKNRTDATQETHAKDATNAAEATKEVVVACRVSSGGEFPDALITKWVPQVVHLNHNQLFDLAREVRTFEDQKAQRFPPAGLREIFDRWQVKAKPFMRVEQSQDEYFMEFMKAYLKVKCLIGEAVFKQVMARARKAKPAKEVTAVIMHPGIRLLATLCRELQRLWGCEPFYLSCRMVEKEFHVSVSTASLWLNGLEGCGFIKTVVKGDNKTMLASRFRYLLPL